MDKKSSRIIGALCGAALVLGLSVGGFAVGADQTTSSSSLSVEQKIIDAKSKTDHEALAAQYEKDAKDLQAKAQEHKEMARAYEKIGYLTEKHDFVRHCNSLAQKYEEAAKENLALAKLHRGLAVKAK
ncbi:MAG: hypothetical protein KGN31_07020 [Betaproteobacteria bacterium]|jgi:hypothetical protein|nr:hypothetical protein [Betaproteobacteria bacterium]